MKKDVKGYEGQYSVDSLGNIHSTPVDGKPNRILKRDVNKRGHSQQCRVTLSKCGKTKRFLVHRLVADAFIPNPENKPYINHIDNNAENNSIENLEWCTQSENIIHAESQGRMKSRENVLKAHDAIRKKACDRKRSMINEVFDNRRLLEWVSGGKHPRVIFECLECGNIYETYFAKKNRIKTGTCVKCKV